MSMSLPAGRGAAYREARARALQARLGVRRAYERHQSEDVCERLSRIAYAALLQAVAMRKAGTRPPSAEEKTDVQRQEERFGSSPASVALMR